MVISYIIKEKGVYMLSKYYLDKVLESLSSLIGLLEPVKSTAGRIVQAVLNGKKVYVMDRFNIVDAELVERPSGLALFRSYKKDGDDMSDGDIFILSAYYPENETDLSLLELARSQGAFTVTISPEGALSQMSDSALINKDDSANGIITIPEVDNPLCPLSGIINVTLAWALVAEITAALLQENITPTVFYGEYLAGYAGKNSEARKNYVSLGY